MGILTISEGGLPSASDLIARLTQLNDNLLKVFSAERLGDQAQRRQILEQYIGTVRGLKRLENVVLESFLGGRPIVGVDGSVISFGGEYPHYMDFMRALALSTDSEKVVQQDIYCPLDEEVLDQVSRSRERSDEQRQGRLAELEIRAAIEAVDRFRPRLLLMDGPLVRFDMRANHSFNVLRQNVLKHGVILCGCIENIESRVIASLLPPSGPEAWRAAYDRDILWDVLQPGDILEVRRPAKGLGAPGQGSGTNPAIRTWFARTSWDPGVVGFDMLESQAETFRPFVDYLYTLTPLDGRGIPVWLDMVDREVRLTHAEMEAYLDLVDPGIRARFMGKRAQRIY